MRPITAASAPAGMWIKGRRQGSHRFRRRRLKAPVIAEKPGRDRVPVTEVKELGSHHMFLAEVTGVSVDEQWLNERGSLELAKAEPIVYSHGGYYGLSELLGTFGWSVKKKKRCQR